MLFVVLLSIDRYVVMCLSDRYRRKRSYKNALNLRRNFWQKIGSLRKIPTETGPSGKCSSKSISRQTLTGSDKFSDGQGPTVIPSDDFSDFCDFGGIFCVGKKVPSKRNLALKKKKAKNFFVWTTYIKKITNKIYND